MGSNWSYPFLPTSGPPSSHKEPAKPPLLHLGDVVHCEWSPIQHGVLVAYERCAFLGHCHADILFKVICHKMIFIYICIVLVLLLLLLFFFLPLYMHELYMYTWMWLNICQVLECQYELAHFQKKENNHSWKSIVILALWFGFIAVCWLVPQWWELGIQSQVSWMGRWLGLESQGTASSIWMVL